MIDLTPTVLDRHAVLYVDDNEWSRTVFAKTVCSFVSVDLAESSATALEYLRRRSYSVIVTDYRMPDLNGIELCAYVREHYPHVHRMLVTAYGDLEVITDAINRGGIAHFATKPWRKDLLVHALRELLTRVELERTVRTLQDDIRQREKELALSTKLHSVLHDMSNLGLPLRTVLLDLHTMLREPSLSGDVRATLGQQHGMLDQIVELHEKLLQRAKAIEVTPPRKYAYRVTTALETARALVISGRDGPAIEIRCDDPRLEFIADLVDVMRILVNLLQNAHEAISGAGVLGGRIVVTARQRDSDVEIEVVDNGPGIPEDRRERIFERGYSTRINGSGLGLTICRELTMMNGGTLDVGDHSTGGQFILRLPAVNRTRKIA